MKTFNIKTLLFMVIMSMVTINAFSIPAKRGWRTVTLANGTSIEVQQMGDEHANWFVDRDNRALDIDENGIVSYLTESQLQERKTWGRSCHKTMNKIREARLENMRKSNLSASKSRRAGSMSGDYTGEKKCLIILVQFPDLEMTHTHEEFFKQANERGYSDHGGVGSISDYFYDQSYGKMRIDFDVAGPYTLSEEMSYYGQKGIIRKDKRAGLMVWEAVKAADKDVNYADYDWNNDGQVEQIYVVYAGYGEATGGKANTVWPHQWSLSAAATLGECEGPVHADGVTVDTYACGNELESNRGTQMVGIGTMCHEFSHCLGYPDVYDTNYINFGMNSWDIMDSGSYNGNSDIPAGYTSYERWAAGWLEPTVLNEPCEVSEMKALVEEPEAYVIYNDAHKKEFYMLENRQKKGWDAGLGGHGMLVVHVDYDRDAWMYNNVNTTIGHQRMTVIPADDSQSTWNLNGDPFPGSSKKTELTDTSTPAATLYNENPEGNKYMSKPITNIQEKNGLISFNFMDEATSIKTINSTKPSSAIYNLSGEYLGTNLNTLPKGIYIIGTRKVVK